MIKILLALLFCMLAASPSARELYPGQYDNVDAATQQWFRSQKSPKTGGLCCNEADGTYAEEDIVSGHYWARWRIGESLTAWLPVPDDVVIKGPNRNGSAVVWYSLDSVGFPTIRCFIPGGGV